MTYEQAHQWVRENSPLIAQQIMDGDPDAHLLQLLDYTTGGASREADFITAVEAVQRNLSGGQSCR